MRCKNNDNDKIKKYVLIIDEGDKIVVTLLWTDMIKECHLN